MNPAGAKSFVLFPLGKKRFAMPAEAIKTGAVDQVLALDNIYAALEKRVLFVFGAQKVGAL